MNTNQADPLSNPLWTQFEDQPGNQIQSREDQEHNQLPPDYDPPAPEYTVSSYHTALHTYHLRATNATNHKLVPFGPTNGTSYELIYKSTTSLNPFSKRPDISLSRLSRGPNGELELQEDGIASIKFRTGGTVPWHPRAVLTLKNDTDGAEPMIQEFESKDFLSWTFEHNGTKYVWTHRDVPCCIELSPFLPHPSSTTESVPFVISRFTYSQLGNHAHHGGDVGVLDIFSDSLTSTPAGMEIVIGTCVGVVRYFKSLGRKYRNEGTGGSAAAGLLRPDRGLTSTVRGGLAYI